MKGKTDFRYIAVIIILLAVIALLVQNTGFLNGSNNNPAVKTVSDIYSLITENPAEVLKVDDQSGLYKVELKTTLPDQTSRVVEAYVTKDGTFLISNPIPTANYTQELVREKNFTECLFSRGIRVAGQSTDQNTITQLRLLGNYGYKIFFDCTGANLQVCQQAGISQIPTTIVVNSTYPGIQTLQFFQTASGCTF